MLGLVICLFQSKTKCARGKRPEQFNNIANDVCIRVYIVKDTPRRFFAVEQLFNIMILKKTIQYNVLMYHILADIYITDMCNLAPIRAYILFVPFLELRVAIVDP